MAMAEDEDDVVDLLCVSSQLPSLPFPIPETPPNEWCTASPDLLFRVPETLRSANRDVYRPRIFHFSPYAPEFFESKPVLHSSSPSPDSAAAHSDPLLTADNRFKTVMVEDLMGAGMLDALVKKMSELSNRACETLRNMYPERPSLMDNLPTGTLARLFASSAAIIVSSFIFYGSSEDLVVRRIGLHSPVVRHPIVYRYYAIIDAIIAMDNQIPILLLKLVCESLYEPECPGFAIDFCEGSELRVLFSDDTTRLLVYILRRSLKFVTPFEEVAQSIWERKDLLRTSSWIERYPLKPLMAYIYDSLVGPLPGTNGASNKIAGSPSPDEDDRWGWESPCRMVSASQLRSWGVKFRAENNGSCFAGIRFDEKTTTLILPVITLQDNTMPFLCNLMAYELTTMLEAERNLPHVASFVLFLDYLIDTEEDVQVLAEAGVLRSYIARSNASIAKMLDRLVDAMVVDLTPDHIRIVKQLRKACRRRWGRWWASFKETYWEKKPWLLISVAVATVLLVLTVLQTVYTMRQG